MPLTVRSSPLGDIAIPRASQRGRGFLLALGRNARRGSGLPGDASQFDDNNSRFQSMACASRAIRLSLPGDRFGNFPRSRGYRSKRDGSNGLGGERPQERRVDA